MPKGCGWGGRLPRRPALRDGFQNGNRCLPGCGKKESIETPLAQGNVMSLTKQLWLAVAAIMTIAFGISFLVSAWSAKNYLEDQLRLKNIDNANSLALSMSQIEKDPVLIELLLSAQFDIGHYKQIKLTSPTGKVMIERVSD